MTSNAMLFRFYKYFEIVVQHINKEANLHDCKWDFGHTVENPTLPVKLSQTKKKVTFFFFFFKKLRN